MGYLADRTIECNTFVGRYNPFCSIRGLNYTGAANKLRVANIIAKGVVVRPAYRFGNR